MEFVTMVIKYPESLVLVPLDEFPHSCISTCPANNSLYFCSFLVTAVLFVP